MKDNFKIQVKENHYSNDYDDTGRFLSYFCQIDMARKLNPKKILEVGIGNKTVSNYLIQNKYNLTTCDFDKSLNPDIVADIKNLPIKANEFDLVMACEILEHLPWKDFCTCINELHRVSSKYVIISIPYKSLSFQFILKMPLIGYLFNKYFISLLFRVPVFWKKHQFDGEHYWEMGSKGYSKHKIEKIIKTKFKIIKERTPLIATNHHFFLLKKKD